MGKHTEGASAYHVELPILDSLSAGKWMSAGEIKDIVGRNADLPVGARMSLASRGSEPQVRNEVQNMLSPSRGSLTRKGFVEYDRTRGLYRITQAGHDRRAELQSIEEIAASVDYD